MMKLLKWIVIGFFALVGLGLVLDALKTPEEKAADAAKSEQVKVQDAAAKKEQAQKEQAALPLVTASQLVEAYEENTVAADLQFKGKKYKVTGTVGDINTDFTGDPYITLRGGNEFLAPQFGFEKSAAADLAKIKKGDKVTMVCEGAGDVAKTPMSRSCVLL
jgi:hypothetical protein